MASSAKDYLPNGNISPKGQSYGESNGNSVQDLCKVHMEKNINGPSIAEILFIYKNKEVYKR